MAKQKFKLNSNIFIDEYEKEIELSTKRNLDRLEDDKAIRKAHAKIADVLKSENQNENAYLTITTCTAAFDFASLLQLKVWCAKWIFIP